MKKQIRRNLIIVILIFISLILIFLFFSGRLSIIPELDNRITYIDANHLGTQFISVDNTLQEDYENDKFICEGNNQDFSLGVSASNCAKISQCYTKKDFSRLHIFIRIQGGANSAMYFGDTLFQPIPRDYANYEFISDNLNKGVYDVFVDGEFIKRLTNVPENVKLKFIAFKGGCEKSNYINWEYIKYVPSESFTIKNDEVWVKEIRGSDYSFKDLNWEMIGFHSQIRPATIRDLTTQTEVPAPQIYINLINELSVKVQPNTVHTFFYKTKWTQGLDSSCQGDLDKVEIKVGDKWICENYVKETSIIQQCQTKSDCAILLECESQKDLISCNQETHLCNYTSFSPACKNQLITYQEKVTEIEKTKFIPIPSGANSFFCFFDKTSTSCKIGEKTLSVNLPSNNCAISSDSHIISNSDCFSSKLDFNSKQYDLFNNVEFIADYNIKLIPSISATYLNNKLRDNWAIVVKGTLPDNFLGIKGKALGDKFILQNSDDKVTFTITNNLGFGIDGGYTIQTQNLALEGGVILRDETKELFLKNGDNNIIYNFETKQLGTIIDIIGTFGKVTTDREYIMKSSKDGKQKFLALTKEVVTEIPKDIQKVQPKVEIVEKIIEKEVPVIIVAKKISTYIYIIIFLFISSFVILYLTNRHIFRKRK